MRWLLYLSVAAYALWLPVRLLAQATDEEALMREGVELRKLGRDAEALDVFRRVHAQQPSARAQAQIALAEQALGHWAAAEIELAAALSAVDDPWIRDNHGALDIALRTIRGRLGTLAIESNVVGATVIVNGIALGRTPLSPIRQTVGPAHVVLQATGYTTIEKVAEVAAGAITSVSMRAERVQIEQRAEPSDGHVSADRPAGAHKQTVRREEFSPSQNLRDAPPVERPIWISAIGWIAMGAATAFLATGVVSEVVREHNVSRYNDDSRCFHGTQTRDQRCGAYRDAADVAQAFAILAFSVGGAALVTGVLSLGVLDAPESAPRLRLTTRLGVASGSASCELRF